MKCRKAVSADLIAKDVRRPRAEHLVAELARVLSRPLPEVAGDAPPKEIPIARAQVLLDGAPEHLLLHGLLTLNAIHSALKGPWLGHHDEIRRAADEMYQLSQRLTHKRDRLHKDLHIGFVGYVNATLTKH